MEGTGRFREEGFYMPEPVLDADKVISIPAMKTTIYGTTLVVKNYVGTLASRAYGDNTSKTEHYQNNPEHGYVDLFAYHPADYAIVEGFWATEGDGPQWGRNAKHNVVVAGSDPLATEAIANIAMGYNPLDLEALYLAAAKGYGTIDPRRIQIVGREPESVQRHFAKSRGGGRSGFFYGRGIRRWLVAGPFDGNDINAQPLPDERDLQPAAGEAAASRQWVPVEHLGYTAERLDLGAVNGTEARKTNYAFTLVHSDREQDGFLWLGFDEHLKAWVNGEVVFEKAARTPFALAGDRVPVHLQRGENRLLFKVGNFAGETYLAAHVVDVDGDRLPGIEFALPGEVVTAVTDGTAGGALPAQTELLANYPNPFNPATTLRLALAAPARARVVIHDITGQRVRALVDGPAPAGLHEVLWDGRDDAGRNVASGVYVAVMETSPAAGRVATTARRMTLLR